MDVRLARTFVAFPASVVEVEGARCAVRPAVDFVVRDVEGRATFERAPVLYGVPLCWPRSPRAGVTFPVEAGDPVLVVVTDRPIGDWLARAATSTSDVGSHCLEGAVAIPGLLPDGLEPEPVDHPMFGFFGPGAPGVHVHGDEVRLGDDTATSPVALADRLETFFGALLAATPVLNDGGAAIQAAAQTAWDAVGGSCSAEKVRAK